MERLVRTRAAGFSAEDALTLDQIEGLRDEGRLEEVLVPVDALFSQYPAYVPEEGAQRFLQNGNPLEVSWLAGRDGSGTPEAGGIIRVYGSDGNFAGLYEYDGETGRFRPKKLFFLS